MIQDRIAAAAIDARPVVARRAPRPALRASECLITALFERLVVWATRNTR